MKTQTPTPKGGESKGREPNEGKGSVNAVKFTCLKPSGDDTVIEEIPENEVNVATRRINLASALGVGDWGGKTRPKYCSSIIDT